MKTCAECLRPVSPGTTWCSTRCRNADDQHDRFDDFEMGDDQ